MVVFALCAASLVRSAAAVAGVQPRTSPPVAVDGSPFDPRWMDGATFVFFKLHGLEGSETWYGDDAVPAVTAAQLAEARIPGAMVFAANCFGGPGSPMVAALLAAGAAAVVTGKGLNWAGTRTVDGIDVLALAWRRLLGIGLKAETALSVAKMLAVAKRPRLRADVYSFSLVGKASARLTKEGIK